jgi:hypothetical protein
MRQKRHRLPVGDVLTISTNDRQVAVGQVIGREPDMMRSATVALFDERHRSSEAARIHGIVSPKMLFSVLFVMTNHLDSGKWPVIDHPKVAVPRREIPTNPPEAVDSSVPSSPERTSSMSSYVHSTV